MTPELQPMRDGVIRCTDLVMRLERIAKKNDDRFRYKVTIEPNRRGVVYLFYCEETADSHTLICGSGVTINEAVKQAWDSIESFCEEWSYDVVA
jgi:hypothetical protein